VDELKKEISGFKSNAMLASSLTALMVLGATWSSPAFAQSTEASSPLSANLTLATDYRFRGISQTNKKPTVQGGFDYALGPAYVGTWASNISWLADGGGVSSSVEMDFYGGYTGSIGAVEYDVGGLYYYYPGTFPAGFNDADTFEVYGGVSWQGFSAQLSYALTDLFGFDNSDGSTYLDLGYEMELSGFTIGAHIGNQRIPSTAGRSSSDCSYTDWSLSGSYTISKVDLTLAYIDSNAKECYTNGFGRELGSAGLVLSVGTSF